MRTIRRKIIIRIIYIFILSLENDNEDFLKHTFRRDIVFKKIKNKKELLFIKLKEEIKQLDDLVIYFNKNNIGINDASRFLEGFNLTKEYFDFDYGVATHTIRVNVKKELELAKEGIELWDDNSLEYFGTI